ncbi:MAG: putative lipid II flippase FtsW [Candidatus Binatus sp.]|jgi:cell division protein FtsW|uniref:putative lipid II flippase FtsW n=1 Tax=Candidatus Binatus sp. TaxID=2811406 RepID=UPI003CAC4BE6
MRNAATYIKSWFGRFDAVTYRRPDPWLWLPAAALLLLGLLMVLNTTYFLGIEKRGDAFHFFKLHLAHIAVGFVILTLLSQFSLAGLRRIVMPLFIVSLVMLVLLYVPGLGLMKGGARRWLRLGPVVAEPSELVKFALVFFLAKFLSKRQDRIREFTHGPLAVFLIVGPITLMILKQPDFGSTVMIALILFAMLWAAGARWDHLAAAGSGALGLLVFQAVAKSYRMKRLTTFLDPWSVARGAGFQLVQSFIALGEGGKWGVGLGAGRQKMFYLPEAHTDFVFAVVGEEFGLAGAAVVVALFLVILFRGMRIAHDEPDPFASLLAVGLTALLSIQALINMSVVIGLIPTKGLPLPFLSYGGTSIIIAMAALGALLALGRRPAVR